MLRLLEFLLKRGVVTQEVPSLLSEGVTGFPHLKAGSCIGADGCRDCITACPTSAIMASQQGSAEIQIDRGACINCGECILACPTGALENDRSTRTFALKRGDLMLPTGSPESQPAAYSPFLRSLNVRVVSTGCAACDLEVVAAGNPIFDMERFGIKIVASPRFADVLLVTGPVPKSMHASLKSCFNGMPDPKIVIACGTCATSGGVHRHGYTEANGVDSILPVDLYIPGCPPHPWQIITAMQAAAQLLGKKKS